MVLNRSGLGNPTSGSVLREAHAVLQSIFPNSELQRFITKSRLDKRAQVIILKTGVCLVYIFT